MKIIICLGPLRCSNSKKLIIMTYYEMLQQHGEKAIVPSKEFVELLECKLECLKRAQQEDSSCNYDIEDLETEIRRIKGFISLMEYHS